MKSYTIYSGIVRGEDGKDIIEKAYQDTAKELNGMPELSGLELTISPKNEFEVLYTKELDNDLRWIYIFNDALLDNLEKIMFEGLK